MYFSLWTNSSNALTDGVIALDPSVRKFMTAYDPDGFIHEWSTNDMNRIWRLEKYKFELQSQSSKWEGQKKRGLIE